MKQIKNVYAIRFKLVNGLKQEPKDLDFEITPSLCFSHANEREGGAWGLFIKWGYWAYGLVLYKVFLKN